MDAIEEARSRSDEIRKSIEQAVRRQRARANPNEDSKVLDSINDFITIAQTPPVTIKRLIHEAALVIFRTFSFRVITIGLKSEEDGRYRYVEYFGVSKAKEEAYRKLSYSLEEFFDPKDYPSIRLSKFTELCIIEENPNLELEKLTYDQPTFLSKARSSPEEFVEGDYIDIAMFNPEDEMIGWIELGRPIFNKMPSIQTIKRLELFASVLSILIQKALLAKKC